MFPEWHHAVPESAYFKLPETLKTFRMYPISRFVYVLYWLATRLQDSAVLLDACIWPEGSLVRWWPEGRQTSSIATSTGGPHKVVAPVNPRNDNLLVDDVQL